MRTTPESSDPMADLQRENTRLALGAQVAGLALMEVDYVTDLKHLTAEAARMFGLGSEAMIVPRARIHAMFHPADLAALEPLIAASLDPSGEGWFAMDHRIVRPDGEVRWLRVRQQVFFGDTPDVPRPLRAIVGAIDITAERTTAAALAESEERMHLAAATTGIGFWEWNVITNVVRWDAQMFLIYGQPPTPNGMVPYTAWSGAVLPEDLPRQQEVLHDTLHRIGSSSREFCIRRADDGECRHIQCFESVRANAAGQAEWVVGTNLDVTDRRRADDMLRRNEALFTALISQVPVGVYVVDAQFRLHQMNPTALRDFATIQPLIGRDFGEIVRLLWPAKIADEVLTRFRHTLATGEPHQAPDLSGKRRDTGCEKVYEWAVQRVTMPDGGHGVACFYNDITERQKEEKMRRRLAAVTATNRKLEREIARRQSVEDALTGSQETTKRHLETSQRLEAEMRLLSRRLLTAEEEERKRISRELHDVIAQTLTGIHFGLSALESQADAGMVVMHQKIARTQQLVESAVDSVHRFARDLRPSMLDDLGLVPALHDWLQEFTRRTGIPVTVTGGEPGGLEGSGRTVLFRIAQEALTNVERHAGATSVALTLTESPGKVRMEITDNGRGFSVDAPPRPDRHCRLGLLGMRERAEMTGGTFSLESAPGGPTSIRVEIPTAAPSPEIP